jgi:hypothetical protein
LTAINPAREKRAEPGTLFFIGEPERRGREGATGLEDVIGIRFFDRQRGDCGILSWGRLHDPVDGTVLLGRIRALLPAMGFHDIQEIAICEELGELSAFKYFFEGLLVFSAEVPTRMRDRSWMAELERDDDALRKTLYLLSDRRTLEPSHG